jgi:hypothetical protein
MALQPMRLTTNDVADLLRVSPDQVREYVEQGRLIARCEGTRRLYFLPHEVQQFCEAMPVYGAGAAIQAPATPQTFPRRGAKKSA